MSNPVLTWVNTFNAALASGVCANLTFSFAITQQYNAWVPVRMQFSGNQSFAGEVWTYRSTDGGNNWGTEGSLRKVFDRVTSGAAGYDLRQFIELEPGHYLVRVVTGSGTAATYSCQLQTAQILTAYI